ncbi:olfactory receptor 8D1-like [Bombina bombina]|uniref:olfactory receptor 8D1-like n=1 Tax=Bombina bombina TaxID=8345 RepID=UPI00235ADF05|nr:olfactory receptor 8D1-like [Bombina bombina]
MDKENQTMVTFFILKGLSEFPELQSFTFLMILLIYLITVGGNLTILLLVYIDAQLHTPMYFLLANLSLMDMCSTTVTLHKLLTSFISRDYTISFQACMAQMFLFSSLARDEMFILTAMSYDRYVAISNPLRYPVIMSHRVCSLLAMVCWVFGFIEMIPYLVLLSTFSCYRANIIDHFYCDMVPLMKLSCSDISVLEMLIYTDGLFFASTPFCLTFLSYIFIIITILKIQNTNGRLKAFYTCSSHLTVVIILYSTLFFLYLSPSDSLVSKKTSSLLNTAVVPFLNPIIYSLKNKDVKSALRRHLRHCKVIFLGQISKFLHL